MTVSILFKAKKGYSFIYGAGCGTERMKLDLSQAFQSYFTNAIVLSRRRYLCSGLCYSQRPKKQFILGTGSNCSYFDGKELHQKYSH
jgi:hypothetical protein